MRIKTRYKSLIAIVVLLFAFIVTEKAEAVPNMTEINGGPVKLIYDYIGHYELNYTGNTNNYAYWNNKGSSKLLSKNYKDRTDISTYNNSSGTIGKSTNNSKIKRAYLIWETRSEKGVTEPIVLITPHNYGVNVVAETACKDIRTNSAGQEFVGVYTMATDVTSVVCSKNGGYGTYTVANIPIWEGAESGIACGGEAVASWQLVIVEESPDFPLRTISLNMMSQYFYNVDYSIKVDFADASAPNGEVSASFIYGQVDIDSVYAYDGVGYEDDYTYKENGHYFRYKTPTRGLFKNGISINNRDTGTVYQHGSSAIGAVRAHLFDDKRRMNNAGFEKFTYLYAGTNRGANTFLYGIAIDIFAYDIIFDGNGADSGTMENLTCVYGRGYDLPENEFSKKYYEFAGWSTNADGSGKIYDNKTYVSNLTSTEKSITLYAQWKPKGYHITLDHQDATEYGTANYYEWYEVGNYTDNTCMIEMNRIIIPTKVGNTFGGYYSGLNGNGTQYIMEDGTITATCTSFTGDTTLYAKWTPAIYKITLDHQGADTIGTTQYFQKYNVGNYTTEDCSVAISRIVNPSKTHYTFKGYYTGINGEGQRIIDSGGNISTIYTLFDTDMTLYAYWEPVTYTITLDNQDPTTMGDTKYYEMYGVANFSEITNVTSLIGSKTVTYNYTGGVQAFEAPFDGTYTLTAYGAGGTSASGIAGKVKGTVYLKKGERLWVNVGGKGTTSIGGYNGGGNGGVVYTGDRGTYTAYGGGGATDFRRDGYALDNRIMVAGGSGGAVKSSSTYMGGNSDSGRGKLGKGIAVTGKSYSTKDFGSLLDGITPYGSSPAVNKQGAVIDGGSYTLMVSLLHKGSLGNGATGAGGGYYGGSLAQLTYTGKSNTLSDGLYICTPGAGSSYVGGVSSGVMYGLLNSSGTMYYSVNGAIDEKVTRGAVNGKATITYHNYNTSTELKEAISITIPVKKGYRFNGYFTGKNGTGIQYVDDSGNILSSPTTFTANTTLYAHWVADGRNIYRIAFNGNGATDGRMDIMECGFHTNYTLHENTFTKKGYTFAGWNTKQDGSGTGYEDKAVVKNLSTISGETITLYAQWTLEVASYYVEHYVEGFEGQKKWMLDVKDEYLGTTNSSIWPNSFIKTYTGYSYSHAEVKGNKIETAVVQADGSLVIHMYYTRNSHMVMLNKDEGIESVSGSGTYKYGDIVNIKADIGKGYHWYGWVGTYTSEHRMYTFSMPDSDVIMTATTSPIIFKISLDQQGATEEGTIEYYQKYGVGNYMDEKCTTIMTSVILPQKTGYIFNGYYTKVNGGGSQYIDEDGNIKASSVEFTEDTTLYAYWKPIVYSIRFEGNGSNGGSMRDIICTYDMLYILPKNAFTKSHYAFNSWNTKADGSGDTLVNGSSIENLTTVQNEVITLYAQWTANKYTIHFDANGGIGYMEDIELSYDVPERLLLNTFTKNNGYGDSVFLGWNIRKDTREVLYKDGAEVVNATEADGSTLILYAVWDDCPWINATDQYYSLDDARNGRITYDELISRAIASDREDGDDIPAGVNPDRGTAFTIIDYHPSDFLIFASDGSVTETYQVVDSVGNSYRQTVTIYIVDTEPQVVKPEGSIRFINENYYNESYENGGLEDKSIWKINSEYKKLIEATFENSKNDTPIRSYLFEYEDMVQMKQFVKENGIGNSVYTDALERFYKLFMESNTINYNQ